MAKHSHTNRRQQPTNCLSVFNHFVGLALKGLRSLAENLADKTEKIMSFVQNGANSLAFIWTKQSCFNFNENLMLTESTA